MAPPPERAPDILLFATVAPYHGGAAWRAVRERADVAVLCRTMRTQGVDHENDEPDRIVRWLLGRGADAATTLADGTGVLHLAACIVDDRRLEHDDPRLIERLVVHGAAPDAVDGDGSTPLHAAVRGWRPRTTAALIAAGADPRRDMRADATSARRGPSPMAPLRHMTRGDRWSCARAVATAATLADVPGLVDAPDMADDILRAVSSCGVPGAWNHRSFRALSWISGDGSGDPPPGVAMDWWLPAVAALARPDDRLRILAAIAARAG